VSGERVKVRLLFVDDGSYHREQVSVPAGAVGRYERLVDVFLEDPEVLKGAYVDLDRLCAAWLVEEGDEE
jgi:hypothetical protein